MKTKRTFKELYSFPGFRAKARFKRGILGDPIARVVELVRRQKKVFVLSVVPYLPVFMTTGCIRCGMWTVGGCGSMLSLNIGGFFVPTVTP